jgi:hypothetical protein
MTPEQHNKYLAISHFAYGGIFLLMMIAFMVFFAVIMSSIPDGPRGQGGPPPPLFFVFMMGFMFIFYGLMIVPSFVAGYALLKKKSWAKIASIIGGVVAGMNFPLGTAVCVYTLWFLFSEPGKSLYDRPAASALPPAPPTWARQGLAEQPRDNQFRPPDWR